MNKKLINKDVLNDIIANSNIRLEDVTPELEKKAFEEIENNK